MIQATTENTLREIDGTKENDRDEGERGREKRCSRSGEHRVRAREKVTVRINHNPERSLCLRPTSKVSRFVIKSMLEA